MKVIILITTYNRPDLLLDLLKDIKSQFRCQYRIKIYNDCSEDDYGRVEQYLEENIEDYAYTRLPSRYGKPLYWKLINKIYDELKTERGNYIIQLPDDIRLTDMFYPRVIEQYKDCDADALNIMVNVAHNEQYTRDKKKTYQGKKAKYWEVSWLDGCFITNTDLFKRIRYSIPSISTKNTANKRKSSKVGWLITNKCRRHGIKIRMVQRSLVEHKGEESRMRPNYKHIASYI